MFLPIVVQKSHSENCEKMLNVNHRGSFFISELDLNSEFFSNLTQLAELVTYHIDLIELELSVRIQLNSDMLT